MLPKVPLYKEIPSCLLTTHLSLHYFTKLPKDVTVMQTADRQRWEPGLVHEQMHRLKKQHSFQRLSFQGVVVLGHLGAASDHGLVETMLTLHWSLVTLMCVHRHKDGVCKSGPGNRGRSACGPTHVARLEFPRETRLILRCAGKAGNPFHPGLLGEGLGCGFLQTVKDDSNENSLSSKGEHCMDTGEPCEERKEVGVCEWVLTDLDLCLVSPRPVCISCICLVLCD